MKTMTRSDVLLTAAGALALFLSLAFASDASAQFGMPTETLKQPLLIGAPSAPPYVPPYEGQAPPIGDGFAPPPVTPGHRGWGPDLPASHVPGIPPVPAGEAGKAMVNGYVAPYLTPPTEFQATDPGIIDNPPNFYPPPATVTNINPNGGISGSAPTQRWGGQTTRDFGNGGRGGSTITDFGEKLTQKNVRVAPQPSEDGPRPGGGGSARASSLPNAQTTQDLHGNRMLPQNGRQRCRMTIAIY